MLVADLMQATQQLRRQSLLHLLVLSCASWWAHLLMRGIVRNLLNDVHHIPLTYWVNLDPRIRVIRWLLLPRPGPLLFQLGYRLGKVASLLKFWQLGQAAHRRPVGLADATKGFILYELKAFKNTSMFDVFVWSGISAKERLLLPMLGFAGPLLRLIT